MLNIAPSLTATNNFNKLDLKSPLTRQALGIN